MLYKKSKMKEKNKPYLQRVADCYREGSMLNRFYLFLAKKRSKKNV